VSGGASSAAFSGVRPLKSAFKSPFTPKEYALPSKERPVMKIRPLHDRVIVKRLEEDRTSPGGIVIPDTAAEKPVQGKIVAVGKGKILEDGKVRPVDVKVGDKILFGKYSGTEVKVDGEELVVMREEDVMAVIEGK
jgi:chaperonin GroES